MVVLIAVIGYIGIGNMETINSNAADVTNDDLKNIENLQQINSNTLHIRLEIVNLVEGRDASKSANIINTIKDLRKQDDDLITQYEKSELNSDEKDLLLQLKKYLKDYRDSGDQIIQLVSQSNYESAMNLNIQSSELRKKATDLLDKLVQILFSPA